eukprot:COSAG06_NODE_6278_length_3001_cov_8.821847_5_plen_69_part_00
MTSSLSRYTCTNRYCEDYVDGNGLAVGKCNRSHTTVPNEQPGSLWNGEIAPVSIFPAPRAHIFPNTTR